MYNTVTNRRLLYIEDFLNLNFYIAMISYLQNAVSLPQRFLVCMLKPIKYTFDYKISLPTIVLASCEGMLHRYT